MWSAAKQLLLTAISPPTAPSPLSQRADLTKRPSAAPDDEVEGSSVPVKPMPVGEVLAVDGHRRQFFRELVSGDLRVEVGSFVKVFLEEADPDGETLGVGMVLAVFLSPSEQEEEEVFVKVRWFSKPKELRLSKRKMYCFIE